MKDYSQTGEQAAILEALKLVVSKPEGQRVDIRSLGNAPGRFLDIGAWSAETFSNTRALFELGWGGIVIEPSPGPVQNLVKEYGGADSRVKVIAAAVTCSGGLVELEVTDDAVSQTVGERIEPWRATGGFYGRLTVPSISIADLFAQFGGDFQMVSIDTEGTSVDLFAAMMAQGPRPRCVVVEHDDRIVELNQHAQAAHYRQVLLNGNNAVFEWTGR